MARFPYMISALTAAVVLAASPIASATNTKGTADQRQPRVEQPAPPALGANMLAMSMCGDRNEVVGALASQFSETPMAVGQVDPNAVVEILVSESGSWTILATGTDGVSCIVSSGEGFESTTLVRGIDA